MKSIHIYMSEPHLEQLKVLAEVNGTAGYSELIRRAVAEFLKRETLSPEYIQLLERSEAIK